MKNLVSFHETRIILLCITIRKMPKAMDAFKGDGSVLAHSFKKP